MSLSIRIAAITAFAALIIWLALGTSAVDRRWAKIELEIQRRHIASLPDASERALEENIRWLAPHAGIVGPVVINGPRQRGMLHIYTTKPEAILATGCARGNAIYDAELDVVFIDEQIVNPEELPLLGEPGRTSLLDVKDLAFVPVYLRFILLHELGHRQLHRASAGFFDRSNGSREREREADDFAVKTLVSAYSADVVTGKRDLGESAAEFIAIENDPTTPAERVWVDLVGSVYAISFAQMFSASDFSSFYSDAAHPNFVQRASRIFALAIESPDTAPTLKAHSRIFREALVRLQEFSESSYTEIQSPEGVLNVAMAEGRLFVLTRNGKIFNLPFSSISSRRTVNLGSADMVEQAVLEPDQASSADMWGTDHQGLMIIARSRKRDGPVEVQSLIGGHIVASDHLSTELSGGWLGGNLIVPPQPANFIVFDRSDYLTVIAGNAVAKIFWDELRRGLAARAGVPTIHADLIAPTSGSLHAVVFEGPEKRQLLGVAEIGLNGAIKSFLRVRFENDGGGDALGLPGDQVVAVPSGSGFDYLYCTRNRTHFLLFRLSAAKPMELVCRHPFIFDKAVMIGGGSGYGMAAFDPKLLAAKWTPPNHVLAHFSKDSVLSVDLATGDCMHLFPGVIDVEMREGGEGSVVFFVKNGLKLYLLKTKP